MGGWESRKEAKSYGRSDEGIDAGKRVVTKTEESGGEVDASRISLQKSYGVVNLNFEGVSSTATSLEDQVRRT